MDLSGKSALTSGKDGTVEIHSIANEITSESIGKAHSQTHCAVWVGGSVLTAGAESIKLWESQESTWNVCKTWNVVDTVALSVHTSSAFACAFTSQGFWDVLDFQSDQSVAHVQSEKRFTCGSFHCDGLILGAGTEDATVEIWDIKTQKLATFFNPGAVGKVSSLAFSENGYYLATAFEDSTIRLWDLRKLTNFHSIELAEDSGRKRKKKESVAYQLAWDKSGHYLGVAGHQIK